MKNIKLSILIPSFNRVELLRYSLLSMCKQVINFDYEIIVLNDYLADDGTEQLCNSFKEKLNIKYVFTGKRNSKTIIRRNPAFCFNIGIKQAKGEIVILTCPEIYHLDNGNLSNLVGNLKGKSKTIVYPLVVRDDRKGEFLENLKTNNGKLTKSERDFNKLPKLEEYYPFFIAIHKKDIINIGGWDEDMTGIAFDDADLYGRLKLNGEVFLQTSVEVLHLYHKRANYKSEETMKDWHYNKKIWENRKGIIIRNKDKEWGKL